MRHNTKIIIGAAAFHGFKAAFNRRHRRLRVVFNTTIVMLIVLTSILIQAVGPVSSAKLYSLDPDIYTLIGQSRDDAAEYLKLDEKTGTYSFKAPVDADPKAHTGRKTDAYSADFATDPKKGVSYTDTNTNITITVVPKFYTEAGKKVEGDHIVYPMGLNKLTYTLKYNGLKEDIILPSFQADQLDYAFELILPSGVEARQDTHGNIGLYSADMNLYGNVTYGSDGDRELLDKAREKAEKTHLLATIPAPIVKDANSQEYADKASFDLKYQTTKVTESTDNKLPAEVRAKTKTTSVIYSLQVKAHDLKDLAYPVSIDPTIQSTSASDFGFVNDEGGMEIDTSGAQIKRASLGGGSIGSWSTNGANDMPETRNQSQTVVYNGYLYVLGDDPVAGGSNPSNIIYAKLTSGGNISGSWSSEIDIPNDWGNIGFTAYNGYLYLIGGRGNTSMDLVWVAKINSADGNLGSWVSTTTLPNARAGAGVVAHNGYMYLVGGGYHEPNFPFNDSHTYYQTVYYAAIHGDGTLGSWTSTTSYTVSGRQSMGLVTYNNYLYLVGGCNAPSTNQYDCDTQLGDGQYAPINSDGSIGTWSATTTMLTGHKLTRGHNAFAYKGYLIAINGSGTGDNYFQYYDYAPIYTSGQIGAWQTQAAGSVTTRWFESTALYQDRLIQLGGQDENNSNAVLATLESAPLNSAGVTSVWASGGNFEASGSEREGAALVISGGVIIVIGGRKGSTYYDTIRYSTIATDGTIGTWSTSANKIGHARYQMGVAVDRGSIFLAGGYGTCGLLGAEDYCNDVERTSFNTTTGNTGSWDTPVSGLPSGLGWRGISMVAWGGKEYISGGTDSSGTYNTVWYYQQNSDGSLHGDIGCGATVKFCQVTTASSGNFTGAREGHRMIENNGYLYIIGGRVGTTYYNTVQYAKFDSNSNSLLDDSGCGVTWCSTTNFATSGRAYIGSGIWNGYIYITGGCNNTASCTTKSSEVDYAPINGDGTLGTWATTTSLATARSGASSAAWKGFIYTVGGVSSSASLRDIEYASINNGGTGRVTVSSVTSLPSARADNAIVSYNGYIYSLGGCTAFSGASCTTRLTDVVYTKVGSDGSLGAPSGACGATVWCSTGMSALPEARSAHAATVYAGKIFISGGETASGASTDIKSVTINSDGTLGSWSAALSPALPVAKMYHQMLVYNGYIYAIMGGDGSNLVTNTIYYNTINTSGTLGGSWSSGTGPTSSRRQANVAMRGRIYNFGGGVTGDTNSVGQYSAVLNSNGSIGSWERKNWLQYSAQNPRALTVNGRIFFLEDGILSGTFMGAGGIGRMEYGTEALTANHGGGGFTYVKGYLYAIGGCTTYSSADCTTMTATVEKAAPQIIPHTARFSRLYDFDKGVRPNKLITRGTKKEFSTTSLSYTLPVANSAVFTAATNDTITSNGHGLYDGQIVTLTSTGTLPAPLTANTPYYVINSATNTFKLSTSLGGSAVDITSTGSGTHTYKVFENATFGSATTSSDINYDGGNAINLAVASSTTLARYFYINYLVDDTYSAVFPDSGNESNIQAFDVYFMPNAATRLRGGRSFTNGIDRGLNASP